MVALSLGSPARRVVGARDGNDHSARKLLLQLDIVEGSSRKRFSLSSRLSAIRRQCSQEVVLRHKRIPVDLAMLAENPDFSLKPCSEMENKMTEQESEVIGSAGLQLSRRTRADDRYQRGAGIPHRRGCSQSGRLSSRATIHRRSRAASFRAPAQVAYPVDGSTFVGGPVGFPSGGHTTTTIKVAEARSLAEAGADELDMMINLGRFKSGDLSCVRDEIKAVVEMIKPFR